MLRAIFLSVFLQKPMCVTSLFFDDDHECGGGSISNQNSSFLPLLYVISCGKRFCSIVFVFCIEVNCLNFYFVCIEIMVDFSWWLLVLNSGCCFWINVYYCLYCDYLFIYHYHLYLINIKNKLTTIVIFLLLTFNF